MAVTVREIPFKASDGLNIYTCTWESAEGQTPKAVIHIHHGLGEHIRRYDAFAARAVALGFVVVGHDARGHGRTSKEQGELGLGIIPCGVEGAVPRMVMDFHELLLTSCATRPGVPLVVLGHSFGTVIARLVMCGWTGSGKPREPPAAAGLILSAPPARIIAPMAAPFKALLGVLHMYHGRNGFSKVPSKLTFDKYQSKVLSKVNHTGEVTGWEWLNRDEAECKKYLDDPLCGQDMAMGFWKTAVSALLALKHAATYAKFPKGMPVSVFAGDFDFCTIDDLGVPSHKRVEEELLAAKAAVPQVIVYPGARHEIMLEKNKDQVHADMLAFVDRCCDPGVSHNNSSKL